MPNFDPAQPFNENAVAPVADQPFDEFQAMRSAAVAVPAPPPLVASPADVAAAQSAGVAINPALLPAPAPVLDPVAQQLAAQQALPVIAAPAAPAPASPPIRGGTPAGPDQMAGATGEVKAAGQEAAAVGREGVAVAKQSAEDLAKADQLRADEAQASTDRMAALQKQQEAAYKESKGAFDQARADVSNFKFHDFFSSPFEAKSVLSAIGMLLGGASYDANHVNQAVAQVNIAMDRDTKRQLDYLHSKQHLADLAQQGVRDTQSYLAHEMANFHTAEALKKEAVARQVDALSSTTRGRQNIVAAQQLAAGLRTGAAKDAQSAILQGTHNRVMQSQIRLNDANAAHARAAAGAAGTAKIEKARSLEEKVIDALISKDEARLKGTSRSPGILMQAEAAKAAADDLKAARDSGDPAAVAVALMHVKEQSTRFLTGSAPTKMTMQMNEDLKGSADDIRSHVSHLFANSPSEGKKYVDTMLKNIDGIISQKSQQIAAERTSFQRKYYPTATTKGLARSQTQVERAKTNELQLFGPEGGEATAKASPTVMYVGGKAYKLGADGKYY